MSLHSPWRSCHGDGERLDFGGRVEASTLVSGEPEGGSLLAPIQGQTRVGPQLVGCQFGRLRSDQDPADDPAATCHLLDPPHCWRPPLMLFDFESSSSLQLGKPAIDCNAVSY